MEILEAKTRINVQIDFITTLKSFNVKYIQKYNIVDEIISIYNNSELVNYTWKEGFTVPALVTITDSPCKVEVDERTLIFEFCSYFNSVIYGCEKAINDYEKGHYSFADAVMYTEDQKQKDKETKEAAEKIIEKLDELLPGRIL